MFVIDDRQQRKEENAKFFENYYGPPAKPPRPPRVRKPQIKTEKTKL